MRPPPRRSGVPPSCPNRRLAERIPLASTNCVGAVTCRYVMLRSSRSTRTHQPGVSPGAVLGETLRLSYGPVVLTIAALCCEDKNPSKTDAPKYEPWRNRRDASATVASRVSDLFHSTDG